VIAASPIFVSSCVSTSGEMITKAATSSAAASNDFIMMIFLSRRLIEHRFKQVVFDNGLQQIVGGLHFVGAHGAT